MRAFGASVLASQQYVPLESEWRHRKVVTVLHAIE